MRPVRNKWDLLYGIAGTIIVGSVVLHIIDAAAYIVLQLIIAWKF
jgi:hypothetical protein